MDKRIPQQDQIDELATLVPFEKAELTNPAKFARGGMFVEADIVESAEPLQRTKDVLSGS